MWWSPFTNLDVSLWGNEGGTGLLFLVLFFSYGSCLVWLSWSVQFQKQFTFRCKCLCTGQARTPPIKLDIESVPVGLSWWCQSSIGGWGGGLECFLVAGSQIMTWMTSGSLGFYNKNIFLYGFYPHSWLHLTSKIEKMFNAFKFNFNWKRVFNLIQWKIRHTLHVHTSTFLMEQSGFVWFRRNMLKSAFLILSQRWFQMWIVRNHLIGGSLTFKVVFSSRCKSCQEHGRPPDSSLSTS